MTPRRRVEGDYHDTSGSQFIGNVCDLLVASGHCSDDLGHLPCSDQPALNKLFAGSSCAGYKTAMVEIRICTNLID